MAFEDRLEVQILTSQRGNLYAVRQLECVNVAEDDVKKEEGC